MMENSQKWKKSGGSRKSGDEYDPPQDYLGQNSGPNSRDNSYEKTYSNQKKI